MSSSRLVSTLSTAPSTVRSVAGQRAGLVQITVAALLWGTTGVVVQLLCDLTGLNPVSIGFYRLAIAAVLLLALMGCRLGELGNTFRAAPVALPLAGLGLGAYQALYFLAVPMVGVSVATVVSLGLAPVLTVGWEAVQARRLPSRTTVGSSVAGVAGLVLITLSTTQPTAATPQPLLGLLAAIGCGVCYAASTIVGRHLAQRATSMAINTGSNLVGALALAPLALVSGVAVPAQPLPVGLLLYLGLVTTAVAYALFYAGLRTISGGVAAVLTLLEPVAAALLAILILAEPLSAATVAGSVLLVGSIGALYLTPARHLAR